MCHQPGKGVCSHLQHILSKITREKSRIISTTLKKINMIITNVFLQNIICVNAIDTI